MTKNIILALTVFIAAAILPVASNASYIYDNDDPFDGIENAMDIPGDSIQGEFGIEPGQVHHWYTDPVSTPGWYRLTITEGEAGNFVEFYDGDEFLLAMTNCSAGDGAAFRITNRLYVSIYGWDGTYAMDVDRFNLDQDIIDERESFGFSGDKPYFEIFGIFGEDGGDYYCIGPRFGAYLVSDFRVSDPDCTPGLDILIGDTSDADTGVRMLDLASEARFTANRTPDKFFLYVIYGCDSGGYIVRSQKKY